MVSIKLDGIKKAVKNNILSQVSSNFFWSVISEATGKGVFFITNVYLARTLGVEKFGIFTLAQTLTFYFWFAVELGINMYGIREIAKNKEHADEIISPLLSLRLIFGLVVFFIYFALILLIHMPRQDRLVFLGCGLFLITNSLNSEWILKGFQEFRFLVYGSNISSFVFLVGTLYFIQNSNHVGLASFIWAFSFLFGNVALLYYVRNVLGIRLRFVYSPKIWYFHLKESIYFTVSASLMILYQNIPIILLSLLFTNYEVGLFAAPYKVILTICSAGFLIPMSIYPLFSKLYLDDKPKFFKTFRLFQKVMICLGLPFAFLGVIYSKEIIQVLFGSQYSSSVPLFTMMALFVPLAFLRYSFGTVILATGHQRFHIICSSIGLFSLTALGFYLIRIKGLIGGVFSLLLSELIMIISMVVIAQMTFKQK